MKLIKFKRSGISRFYVAEKKNNRGGGWKTGWPHVIELSYKY